MEPIDILIETSGLPRDVDEMEWSVNRLQELANDGLVRIYVSYVAMKEWESQIIVREVNPVDDIRKGVTKLFARQFYLGQKSRHMIQQLHNHLAEMQSEIQGLCVKRVHDFFRNLRACVIEFDPNDASQVFARYFQGDAPFKVPKNRNDLPDAFIYCAALRIIEPGKNLLVVAKDGALSAAFSRTESVEVFGSLLDLLQSSRLVEASSKLDVSKLWTPPKEASVARDIISQQSALEQFVRENAAIETSRRLVWIRNMLPKPRRAEILDWRNADRVFLHFDERFELGSAQISIPFELFVDLDLRVECYWDNDNTDELPSWVKLVVHELSHNSASNNAVGTEVSDPRRSFYVDGRGTHPCIIQGTLMIDLSANDLLQEHVEFSKLRVHTDNTEVVLALGPEDRERQWTIYKTGKPPNSSQE